MMKRISLGQPPANATLAQKVDWCIKAVQAIAEASTANDPTLIANNFTFDAAFSATRVLVTNEVAGPPVATLANTNLVLATLLFDLAKGGANRTT